MIFLPYRKIEDLNVVLRKVLENNLKSRVKEYSHGDLREFSHLINRLIDGLEARYKESSFLKAVLKSMAEGVIAVDRQARIILVNPSLCRIFNLNPLETEGRLFLEAVKNNDLFEVIKSALDKGDIVSREITVEWPIQKIFKVNTTPIFEDGAVTGCLLVIHDITEIRKLEKMRVDFVANVSHELKTPLTSIKGFVETLLEEALTDRENSINFLRIIHEHTNRINRIINDLLELSSLESKGTYLEKEVFVLRPFIEEIIDGLKVQLKEKMLKLEFNIGTQVNINADKDKLRQVFLNLLSNAIKFNKEKGFIKVYSETEGDFIKITIEDSGIGIPEKDIPRIFERFYRVDKGRSRELGGTGLGLSIVKHIVEAHSGNVAVQSTEGLGSKFYFRLPN